MQPEINSTTFRRIHSNFMLREIQSNAPLAFVSSNLRLPPPTALTFRVSFKTVTFQNAILLFVLLSYKIKSTLSDDGLNYYPLEVKCTKEWNHVCNDWLMQWIRSFFTAGKK